MFENFKKIGDEIYVYENFLSELETKNIVDILEKLDDDKWIKDGHLLRTDPLKEIIAVREKIKKMIPDGLHLGLASTATKLIKGDSWGEHSDVHDFLEAEMLAKNYIEGTPYQELELSVYGLVVYFNKFEGGEIYYPTQNIIYAPNPGDMVLHSSLPIALHGVKPVISEKRYSYSNHIYKKVKVSA